MQAEHFGAVPATFALSACTVLDGISFGAMALQAFAVPQGAATLWHGLNALKRSSETCSQGLELELQHFVLNFFRLPRFSGDPISFSVFGQWFLEFFIMRHALSIFICHLAIWIIWMELIFVARCC